MSDFKPTTKQVCTYFFTLKDARTNKYQCKCGTVRKKPKTSWTNLMQHIVTSHLDYKEVIKADIDSSKGSLTNFINPQSKSIYGWIKLIVGKGLPFSCCEDEDFRDFSRFEGLSIKTLMKYMGLLTKEIENIIIGMLPDKIGIMLDGWSEGSEHFFAVFACFPEKGKRRTVLLGFSPPFQEDDLSALSLKDLIEGILKIFQKSLDDVIFYSGDNCRVNTKLSNETKIPLIGCASHRLNLAIQEHLKLHSNLLDKVDTLMKKLQTIKYTARLRDEQSDTEVKLVAIRRNVTRWSSTFTMVKRYLQLHKYIASLAIKFRELEDLVPCVRETNVLQSLYTNLLTEFHSTTLCLQDTDVTLGDAREMLDSLLNLEDLRSTDFGKKHLLNSSPIVHSKDFESAITKLCNNKSDELNNMEAISIMCFLIAEEEDTSDKDLPVAVRVMKKRKKMNSDNYENVDWVPPTSNEVERFFSLCKQVYTKYRKRLLPINLEMQLFLKLHTDIWVDGGVLFAKVYDEAKKED